MSDRIDETAQDDAVIGRALKISALALVVILLGAAAAWWLLREAPEEEELVERAPIAAPARLNTERAERPPLPFTEVGAAWGIDLLEEARVSRDEPVVIFTDSSYSRGVLTQGWKAKANKELIDLTKIRLQAWSRLTVNWVAGHAGIPENERADELAGAAIEEAL